MRTVRTIDTPFTPFREVEILKAIRSLAGKKAPGADALPGEVYKRLTGMLPALTLLTTAVVRMGTLPHKLLEVLIIPLDKPGKDPHLCESKRPISLINTIVKAFEIAVYNRVIHDAEPHMHPTQFAYRRARGTETHLSLLGRFVVEKAAAGEQAYVASLEIKAPSAPYHTMVYRRLFRARTWTHTAGDSSITGFAAADSGCACSHRQEKC